MFWDWQASKQPGVLITMLICCCVVKWSCVVMIGYAKHWYVHNTFTMCLLSMVSVYELCSSEVLKYITHEVMCYWGVSWVKCHQSFKLMFNHGRSHSFGRFIYWWVFNDPDTSTLTMNWDNLLYVKPQVPGHTLQVSSKPLTFCDNRFA